MRRYRSSELVALAMACGLTVETARYADSLGFAALLYRMLGGQAEKVDRAGLRLSDRFVFPVSRMRVLMARR